MIELQFDIGTEGNKFPEGRIWANNNQIWQGSFSTDPVQFKPKIGKNVLEIFFDNKDHDDTVVKDDKIMADLFIILRKIECTITKDNLNSKFDELGYMEKANKEKLKTFGYIAFKGKYVLEFDYPLFVNKGY